MGKINDISHRKKKALDLRKTVEDNQVEPNHVIDLTKEKSTRVVHEIQDIRGEKSDILINPNTQSKTGNLRYITILGLTAIIVINLINSYYKGLWYKNSLLNTVKSGYNSLLHAQSNFLNKNVITAKQNLQDALSNFQSASHSLELLQNQISGYDQTLTQRMVDGVFTSAKIITQAAIDLSEKFDEMQNIVGMAFSRSKESLTEKLDAQVQSILTIKDSIAVARNYMKNIPESLIPNEYKDRFISAQEKIDQGIKTIETLAQYWPSMRYLLGDTLPQRYLVILQNSNEKRPTGGFIGSIAIVDINDGYITKMDVHDVYDFDGQMHEHIEPPEEIRPLTDTWRMRDSNYSPDFAVSAEKIEWFLQKENGPSVDHVIAIDQSLITDVLREIGPIDISLLNKPVSADELELILSYVVESKITGTSTPKTILKELKSSLIEKIKEPSNIKKIMPVIIRALEEKRIQFWSKDEDIQKLIEDMHWGGRIIQQPSNEDYLNIVDISVAGNKSDKYIERSMSHTTFIEANGRITNNIEFTKKHTVSPEMVKGWESTINSYGFDEISETVEKILGNSMQKSMQKIYVPRGSQLVRVEGIDPEKVSIKTDLNLNKDYFYFPMNVEVGEEKTISLTYTIPFQCEPKSYCQYILNYQTQSANTAHFTKKILIDSSINVYETYPAQMKGDEPSVLSYEREANQDFHVSVALGP